VFMSRAAAQGRAVRRARPQAHAGGRGKYDRSQSTEERRGEQRARLLAAAAEIFAAKGYAGARVQDIVARAGMSRRTFYDHFDDLAHALVQLHEHAANLSFRYVEDRVRAQTTPDGKLRAGVES